MHARTRARARTKLTPRAHERAQADPHARKGSRARSEGCYSCEAVRHWCATNTFYGCICYCDGEISCILLLRWRCSSLRAASRALALAALSRKSNQNEWKSRRNGIFNDSPEDPAAIMVAYALHPAAAAAADGPAILRGGWGSLPPADSMVGSPWLALEIGFPRCVCYSRTLCLAQARTVDCAPVAYECLDNL
jgi:hypothetical protein